MSEGSRPSAPSAFGRLRRAGIDKLRRRTHGGLAPDRPVAEQRDAFAALLALTEVAMPEHSVETLSLSGVSGLRLRPQQGHQLRLVFIHGGGYSLGSPHTHRPLAARLAREARAEVVMPAYRRAPEHPCPAGLEDVLALWRALPAEERRQTFVAGDSAGGGLALSLAMALRDAGELLPRGLVLLSPWTDLSLTAASIDAHAAHEVLLRRDGLELHAARYAGELSREDPRVSPLFGDFHGLPNMLIQAGAAEVLLDDARRTAARAEAAGVAVELQTWPEQGHVFQATPLLAAAGEALAAAGGWLRARAEPARS